MFNAYKNLIGGKLEEVDDNKLFILNRWASFNAKNYLICSDLDRLSLGVKNKDLLKYLLYNNMHKQIPKFLKAEKQDKELLDYVKKFYGWSNKELSYQLKLIDLNDKDFLKKLSTTFGWDKKLCKTYGVAWVEPSKEKLKKEDKHSSKSLFSF